MWLALTLMVIAPPGQAKITAPPCIGTGSRSFARKRDLPAGVERALGGAMAEAGQPFLVSDAGPVSALPDRRFVSARQTGCSLVLRYEKGGYAHFFDTVSVTYAHGRWTAAKRAR